MRGVDPFSINGAIANAKQQKKNVYLLSQPINRDAVNKLSESIHRIPGRIRICLKNSTVLSEANEHLKKLFLEPLDFDALIFMNTQFQDFSGFCDALSKCSSLEILSFISCGLSDAYCESLQQALKCLKHLQTFDISHDSIGPVMFSNICHSLCVNSELECFNWIDNQLGDPSAFVDLLKSVPSLRKVDFSGIILTEPWVQTLSQVLDESWQLISIKITDVNPILRQKIERNEARYEMLKKGPAARMSRYAIPDTDDIFDFF